MDISHILDRPGEPNHASRPLKVLEKAVHAQGATRKAEFVAVAKDIHDAVLIGQPASLAAECSTSRSLIVLDDACPAISARRGTLRHLDAPVGADGQQGKEAEQMLRG